MNETIDSPPKQPSDTQIIENRRSGRVYVADFRNNTGKYISVIEDSLDTRGDIEIQLSPRICIRFTYIIEKDSIKGVEISKISMTGFEFERISFSTLDFERILQLLAFFSSIDLGAVARNTLLLDESIITNPDELSTLLYSIAADPTGREKLIEITRGITGIHVGDIDNIVLKRNSVLSFEKLLNDPEYFKMIKEEKKIGKDEEVWQRFFKKHDWILATDFVEILDERTIDTESITDFLVKSYDGFVDIVELKLPTAPFWTSKEYPTSDLGAAAMQCHKYLLEIERRINDHKFIEKLKGNPIAKPKIQLIFGRSQSWTEGQKEAYRILNSSYSNLAIITFDHLLNRAKRIIGADT